MTKPRLAGKLAAMACVVSSVFAAAAQDGIRINGYVAERMDQCIRRHVTATDPLYLTKFFHNRQQSWMWQTEFWGKWMHAAVPLARYSRCQTLAKNIETGLQDLLSTQDADGYIGNYPESRRYSAQCWDVWGTKYTLLGLIHEYDVSKNPGTLAAAEKLAGKLIAWFADRDVYKSGWYRGMPSCSALEPIVWLYKRTGKAEYLEFAKKLRDNMDHENGARLLRDCNLPVFERVTEGALHSSLKSYEMMSCYQGLLELYEVTGERRLLDAAVATAEHILAEEINIAGGAATGEHWYGGRAKQTETYNRQNETCVVTTWLRFCRKLHEVTGESKWADAFERTFYNVYLGALKCDGTEFVQYAPLAGTRSSGEHHCRTFTNCCNANGPRGFVEFLQMLASAKGDAVQFNLYNSGFMEVEVPSLKEKVEFQVYTTYPRTGKIEMWYRTESKKFFALEPRIPGWCKEYTISLNGKRAGLKDLRREWSPGDEVTIKFAMPVEKHVLNDHIAFTRGPIVLARDLRLGGDIGATIRRSFYSDGSGETRVPSLDDLKFDFFQVRSQDPNVWMQFVGILPTGVHSESTEAGYPEAVAFCDFASAGNTWTDASAYRVWLPLLKFEKRR